ncbi:MAG: hypothetical protein WA162_08825 [Thermodesulfobacteriota bacterium]
MKRFFTVIICLALAMMFVQSRIAYSDCADCTAADDKAASQSLKKSQEYENKGDFVNAYEAADGAYGDCCGGKHEKALTSEAKRLKRKAAEQLEAKADAKACWYYLDGGNSNMDSDRALIKYAKTVAWNKPGDFDSAVSNCRPEDMKTKKELDGIASRNADRALEKEAEAFGKKPKPDTEASRELLRMADSWFRIIDDSKGRKRVDELTIKRGDALLNSTDYELLEDALDYYSSIENMENRRNKMNMAKKNASALGDESMGKGDFEKAERFYRIAGDSAKANKAGSAYEKQERDKEKASAEAEEKRKLKFKKESKDLEKELGI